MVSNKQYRDEQRQEYLDLINTKLNTFNDRALIDVYQLLHIVPELTKVLLVFKDMLYLAPEPRYDNDGV